MWPSSQNPLWMKECVKKKNNNHVNRVGDCGPLRVRNCTGIRVPDWITVKYITAKQENYTASSQKTHPILYTTKTFWLLETAEIIKKQNHITTMTEWIIEKSLKLLIKVTSLAWRKKEEGALMMKMSSKSSNDIERCVDLSYLTLCIHSKVYVV